jgi:Domain of unknown function (DUF4440)
MATRSSLARGTAALVFVFVIPLGFFDAQTDAANDKDAKGAVLKAEHDLAMAEVQVDMKALESLYAENFTHSHTSGLVQSKADYMKHLKSGRSHFKSFDFRDERVHFFGATTATVTAHVRGVSSNSPDGHDDTVLEVWVLEKGAWRCAAWAQARHLD